MSRPLSTGGGAQWQDSMLLCWTDTTLSAQYYLFIFIFFPLIFVEHYYHVLSVSLVVYMEPTAPKEKVTGETRPATALELGTYALSRSFSHTSHGDRSGSSVPHRPSVPVTDGCYPATLKTCTSRLVLCAV